QDGHSLRVTVGPAVTFKPFPIEEDQPLRARADEEFGVEDGDRGQITLRQPVERGVTPLHFPVLTKLDQPAVSRGEDRAVQSRQAASGAAALNQSPPTAGESPPQILLERRERPLLGRPAGRLEFTFGSAFDRPRGDYNSDRDQQRERRQETAMRP